MAICEERLAKAKQIDFVVKPSTKDHTHPRRRRLGPRLPPAGGGRGARQRSASSASSILSAEAAEAEGCVCKLTSLPRPSSPGGWWPYWP